MFGQSKALNRIAASISATPDSELVTLLPKNDLHKFIGWLTKFEAELTESIKLQTELAE